MILSLVALSSKMEVTSSQARFPSLPRIKAATPQTCGEAMEVPEMVIVLVVPKTTMSQRSSGFVEPPIQAAVISVPGAKMLTQAP